MSCFGGPAKEHDGKREKALNLLKELQTEIQEKADLLKNGALADVKDNIGQVRDVSETAQKPLSFPDKLRSHADEYSSKLQVIQDSADTLSSIPFADAAVEPLVRFLAVATKPVGKLKNVATKAEEVTGPATREFEGMMDHIREADDEVTEMESGMDTIMEMVSKCITACEEGVGTSHTVQDTNEELKNKCGPFGKMLGKQAAKAYNPTLFESAENASRCIKDSLEIGHGSTKRMKTMKDRVKNGGDEIENEVTGVTDKVSVIKRDIEEMKDDCADFPPNVGGIKSKCENMRGTIDELMNFSGNAITEKVNKLLLEPIEILKKIFEAIKNMFKALMGQSKKLKDMEHLRGAEDLTREESEAHAISIMDQITADLRPVIDSVKPILGVEIEDPEPLFDGLQDDDDEQEEDFSGALANGDIKGILAQFGDKIPGMSG